jgi:hypothetical protein
MKKVFFVLLILIQLNNVFSQVNNDDIAFELRYPIPMGNNYLNKAFGDGYLGIVDIGVDYNFIKINNLGIGILFNSSIFRLSETDLTLVILSPKIKLDYKININKVSIIPAIAVGYSNWRFTSPSITMTDEDGNPVQGKKFKEKIDGLSIKGATKVVLNSNNRLNWYMQLAYEFFKLEKPENGAEDSKYNRNMHILYPGFGLIWKFNKE